MATKLSPKVRGICGLTWAMTYEAFSTAALTVSTATPREQLPKASGGVTWTRATSMCRRWLLISLGISDRKMGVKSASPRATASRAARPTKKVLSRNMSLNLVLVYGETFREIRWSTSVSEIFSGKRARFLTRNCGSAQPVLMKMRLPGLILWKALSTVHSRSL